MTEDGLTQAELFDVFSNARRRRAVRYLQSQNGSCDLAPLVERVAAWENDVDPDEVTRAQRRRVYISLYQTHLPMLEEHGIVEWDPEGHRIELLPSEGTFAPYLDRSVGRGRAWHATYATVSIVATLAFALAWAPIGPVSVGLAPFIALACCGVALVLAAAQYAARSSAISFPALGRLSRR